MTEAPKVCRGCFTEWNKENRVCPCCGWEPGKKYKAVLGWTTGAVFEKRYMLGMLYCQTGNAVIWRIYDTALRIPYLVLRIKSENKKDLYLLAKMMKRSETLLQNQICIMSIKTVGKKNSLLFSITDLEKNTEVLKNILCGKVQPVGEQDIWHQSESTLKKKETLAPGTILNNSYQILDCIGIGGFGIIYLCKDLNLQRLAAVKEYFPVEWVNREGQYVTVKKSQLLEAYQFGFKSFYEEAKIMAKFIHVPHVVTIYDVTEANDTAYLVMEYISGISIGREMRQKDYRPYQPEELKEILFPVIEALSIFHEKKIIHRDISPGNIMRSEKGEIFLVDMGAAEYALNSRLVLNAAFLKLDYAPPEQYQTAKGGIPENEGPWTDIYALGATIYYFLTGQKPPNVMQRLSGENTDVVFPKRCRLKKKKQWIKFINHAMALKIQERIQSVEEFKDEIQKLLE